MYSRTSNTPVLEQFGSRRRNSRKKNSYLEQKCLRTVVNNVNEIYAFCDSCTTRLLKLLILIYFLFHLLSPPLRHTYTHLCPSHVHNAPIHEIVIPVLTNFLHFKKRIDLMILKKIIIITSPRPLLFRQPQVIQTFTNKGIGTILVDFH